MNNYVSKKFYGVLLLWGLVCGIYSEPFIAVAQEESAKTCIPVRRLEKILQEICHEKGYSYRSFCDGWVIEIKKPGVEKAFRSLGYNFPLNNAVSAGLCNDKPALAAVLASLNIPHVPHWLILRPTLKGYIGPEGTWPQLLKHFNETPQGLVIKPKDGTGGSDMWRVRCQRDLEEATAFFYSKNCDFSVSPLLEPIDEFRVVWLGEAVWVLCKQRPFVVGDGVTPLVNLVMKKNISFKNLDWKTLDPYEIPPQGQEILLQWQHNLGKGAQPIIMTPSDKPTYQKISQLAQKAVEALDLSFCSVDIVREDNGELKILEINSGIMLENVSGFLDSQEKDRRAGQGWAKAKAIYQKALDMFFQTIPSEKK